MAIITSFVTTNRIVVGVFNTFEGQALKGNLVALVEGFEVWEILHDEDVVQVFDITGRDHYLQNWGDAISQIEGELHENAYMDESPEAIASYDRGMAIIATLAPPASAQDVDRPLPF